MIGSSSGSRHMVMWSKFKLRRSIFARWNLGRHLGVLVYWVIAE